MNKHFTENDMGMAIKHKKSVQLIIREIQFKATIGDYFTCNRMANILKWVKKI